MKKIYRWLLNTIPRPILIRMSYGFKKVAPLMYKGNNVECTVCEKKFRKFLSYGTKVTQRDNVLCPYCLSLERHRLLWYYLNHHTGFFKDDLKMLHMAPEQCFHKTFKRMKNLDYLTADIESPIADIHFDLHKVPLEDNTFDVIFCNHVLEHVEDDAQCMRELHRIMKPGGWGIFQVPQDMTREETYEDSSITSPEEREKHFWQKDHVRLYGMDFPKKLEAAGFRVEPFLLQDEIGAEKVERYRISKSEILYVCHKD